MAYRQRRDPADRRDTSATRGAEVVPAPAVVVSVYAGTSRSVSSATSSHGTARTRSAWATRYARAPTSAIARVVTPPQWSRPRITGWPRLPWYVAVTNAFDPPSAAASNLATASAPMPGVSTSSTATATA